MKINDFVQEFEEKKIMNTHINPNAVSEFIKEKLEVKEYLPFAEKRELCIQVVNACNSKNKSGLIIVDSVSRYLIFTINILSKYTNLDFTSDKDAEFDSLDEYDMLCRNGLLNPILDVIGEEYTSCNNILNMMMSDLIENNNTIEEVVGNATEKLLDIIDKFAGVLSDKVESLKLDSSQVNIDKYKGLFDLLPKK